MGRKANDLTGKRFGRLTVVACEGRTSGNRRWHCRCDCGNEVDVWQPNLLSGRTKSCGCGNLGPGNRHYLDGTYVEMIASKTIFRSNKSGVRGVYWNAARGKWAAQITFQGKVHFLGLYTTLEQAAAARAAAEKAYFGKFLAENWDAAAKELK